MKSKRNTIFSALIFFSFLWVILGDLVAMHMKLIYDIDLYGHQPFAKTKKSDEKHFQEKCVKITAYNFFHDIFIAGQEQSADFSQSFFLFHYTDRTIVPNNIQIIPDSGRSPPVQILFV